MQDDTPDFSPEEYTEDESTQLDPDDPAYTKPSRAYRYAGIQDRPGDERNKDPEIDFELQKTPKHLDRSRKPRTVLGPYKKHQWSLTELKNEFAKAFGPRAHVRLLKKMYDLGMEGNVTAAKEFWDRTLGKAKEFVDVKVEAYPTVTPTLTEQEWATVEKLITQTENLQIEEQEITVEDRAQDTQAGS